MRKGFIAAAALVLAGCAGAEKETFHPAEKATAESPTGFAAAEYDLDARADGRDLAETKVWTRGAYEADVGGEERTVVHVGMEIENTGQTPIALEQIRLDSVSTDDRRLQDLAPYAVEGPRVVNAGRSRDLNAYFALPRGIDPQEVDAFRVKWSLDVDGRRYSRVTPFIQDPDLRPMYTTGVAPFYYSPFYDPFMYPYPTRFDVSYGGFPYYHRDYF